MKEVYYCGHREDSFPIGPCDSTEEAVSEFFSDYGDDIEEEKEAKQIMEQYK